MNDPEMCVCGHYKISHMTRSGSCEFNRDSGYNGEDACVCAGFEEQE